MCDPGPSTASPPQSSHEALLCTEPPICESPLPEDLPDGDAFLSWFFAASDDDIYSLLIDRTVRVRLRGVSGKGRCRKITFGGFASISSCPRP